MRLGIDLGGTKTEIIALDEHGKELYRKRVPSPRDDYQATINNLVSLVKEAESVTGQKGTVGIGIPGIVDRTTGKVKNANSTWLIGHTLDKDLEKELGRAIKVENDANCFAFSEATDGAGQGKYTVFGVILGTGCGGGVVINGKLLQGLNQVGGEWGHNPLPWPTVKEVENKIDCYCGMHNCIEWYISGTGLKINFQRDNNFERTTHEIVKLADEGDEQCIKAMDQYEDRMARSLAHIINVIDPDVIVAGGGMSLVDRIYKNVPKLWNKYIFTDTPVKTKFVPAKYGDSSGVRGAAWLWNNE